jgi:NAD(P)-dependent dehydrogenase (short-subunit alcohol dehydrogenase family)
LWTEGNTVDITGSVALVTGANRGLGARIVAGLLERGAARVYATARVLGSLDGVMGERVVPLALDIDDDASVAAAALAAPDVNLLINNAGVLSFGGVLDLDLAAAERDLRTNYLGTLRATRGFVPVIERNGGGAIANVITIIALAPMGGMAGYCASKAAEHSMTQALRAELRPRGIEVHGAYPGGIDTDMLAGVEAAKAAPEVVAARILDGIAKGEPVIFPDDVSAGAGEVYLRNPRELEAMLTG